MACAGRIGAPGRRGRDSFRRWHGDDARRLHHPRALDGTRPRRARGFRAEARAMSVRRREPSASSAVPGIGLIELMVALVIGLVLILGAVSIYSQSRRTYRAFETV